MKINTGRGTIPLITLIGIWSISALTSLPGLAVSPILGQLSTTFPDASELDIQMLSSLPSLLIIPFILLAGKLAEKRDFENNRGSKGGWAQFTNVQNKLMKNETRRSKTK